MKRILLVLFVILFAGITYAQDNVVGIWGLTEMTVGGQNVKMHRSMHVDFNQNGKLYISGRELGTWSLDKNSLSASSEMQLDIINGNNKILKITDEELHLENEETGIQKFKRASLPYGQEYKNEIVGEYLFVKVLEKKKEIDIGNTIVNFKDNGTLYFQSMFFAQWRYDNKTKIINIISVEKEDKFNGESDIVKSGNELILQTEKGDKLFFKKLDFEEITKNNKVSGLEGMWKIDINFDEMIFEEATEEVNKEVVEESNSENVIEESRERSTEDSYESDKSKNNIETNYLSLKPANMYSYGQGNGNSTGLWIYTKKEKTLYIVGRYIPFSGVNKIVEINEKRFVFIDKYGNKYTAIKNQ
ncbi:MAG: hypothetical protein ABFR75_13545 [Acidobacteriota bacterium]